jgi:hypothetical protein
MAEIGRYALVCAVFALVFTYIFAIGNVSIQDINLHTTAAHVMYKIVVEKDAGLAAFFDVDLKRPASVYHLFYLVAFYFSRSSLFVASLFNFLYFALWGVASYLVLREAGKLSLGYFSMMMVLSINTGVAYNMPALCAAQVAFLFLYSYILRKSNEGRAAGLLWLLPVSAIAFHVLHPFVGILAALTISFYAFLGKDGKVNIPGFLVFAIAGAAAQLALCSLSVPNYDGTNTIIDGFLKDPARALIAMVALKAIGVLLINGLAIWIIYIPLLINTVQSAGGWNVHLKYFALLALFFLLIPDGVGSSANFYSGRMLVFVMMSLIIASKGGKEAFPVIVLVLLAAALAAYYFALCDYPELGSSLSQTIANALGMGNAAGSQAGDMAKVGDYLKDANVSRAYIAAYGFAYGSRYEDIDNGCIYSSMYAYSFHPISSKVETFAEYSNERVEKASFTSFGTWESADEGACSDVASNIEGICGFYSVIVAQNCTLPLPVMNRSGTVSVYACPAGTQG